MERYDLVVIGGGPAGEKGAAQAASFGRRVLLAERAPQPGGAMVHTGTLASKTLRESALVLSGLRHQGFGARLGLGRLPSIEELGYRRIQVAFDSSQRIRDNLARHGVEYVRATASFVDPHTLRLWSPRGERLVHADKVLVATGGRPVRPPLFPFDRDEVMDSDEVIMLPRLPLSVTVVGAGVIGCEYASIFAALGIQVTLVDGRDRVMPFLDNEVGARLLSELRRIGVREIFSASVRDCRVVAPWHVQLELEDGRVLSSECVLVAAGRQSNTDALCLERAGVERGARGLVLVNDRFQTSQPHVYAAGDVIGFPALASTSMEQARVAMCHAFDQRYKLRVGSLLPYGIYTIPECSFVGATEEQLRRDGITFVAGRAELADNARGRIMGESGFVKMLVGVRDQRVLGVHIVGERASELVHVAQAHMSHGGTVDVFIDQVFNFPTLGAAFKDAAYDAFEQLRRVAERQGAA